MPYDTSHKPLSQDLVRKMMKQMEKDVLEFLKLFPDFSPSRLDIKVLGAIPYTLGEDVFCTGCLKKTFVQGKCHFMIFEISLLWYWSGLKKEINTNPSFLYFFTKLSSSRGDRERRDNSEVSSGEIIFTGGTGPRLGDKISTEWINQMKANCISGRSDQSYHYWCFMLHCVVDCGLYSHLSEVGTSAAGGPG